MSQIIIELGSGNTCKNDWSYLRRMIDSVLEIDTGKHEIIFKMQLWAENNPQGANIRLDWDLFEFAMWYCRGRGYKMTASVFDRESLMFLQRFDIPFVKCAYNQDYIDLAVFTKSDVPIYRSADYSMRTGHDVIMLCVPKYPADLGDYFWKIDRDPAWLGALSVSDHTVGLKLFKMFRVDIWEKHLKLEDSTGLDSGDFAITPEELKEIL